MSYLRTLHVTYLSEWSQFLLAEVEDRLPQRPLVVRQAGADVVDRVVAQVSDGEEHKTLVAWLLHILHD